MYIAPTDRATLDLTAYHVGYGYPEVAALYMGVNPSIKPPPPLNQAEFVEFM
jgi:hypothetical protein